MAATVEKMVEVIRQVVNMAEAGTQETIEAVQSAREGTGTIAASVESITAIKTKVDISASKIAALDKHSAQIGLILNTITDMAYQSNILALNAAIEAARAGDAGRGFAVVADEVRKLAEKTMAATREVSDAIRGIQEATTLNAKSVERTVGTIEEANVLADDSGKSLAHIVDMVEQSNDQVRAIAAAAEEQSAASEEINRSLTDINAISAETADGMRSSARAVAELSDQAEDLGRLVAEMAAEGRG